MTMNARLCAGTFLFAAALCANAAAEDWPCWRGPNHDGKSSETAFVKSWTTARPILWQKSIGHGYSGIIVVNGKAYTAGQKDKDQTLYCFDANSGKVLWSKSIDKPYKDSMGWGDGPRGTPTFDDGHIYIMGANGRVGCYNADTGKKIWSREYDARPQWGYSGSVLVLNNLAIVATGGKGGGLRALDKTSGHEVWKAGGDDDSGYSTPYPFVHDGKTYVAGFLGNSAVIVEAVTGREVCSIDWKTDWKVNAATPIYEYGYLFLGSGYRTGCGVIKLITDGDKLLAKEQWQSRRMKNKFQTPVLHDGNLYAFDEKGFKCVNFATGEVRWEQGGRPNENGTVLLADGRLIALTQEGELMIGKASPEAFSADARQVIFEQKGKKHEQCWTVPTLSDGRLYARNLNKIICLDLRK